MDSFVGWELASSIDDGRRHSLAVVRTLAPGETKELDASLRLLWWITTGSRWNSIPESWTRFQESLTSATTEPNRVNQTLFRLLRSLAAFSDELASAPEEHRGIAEGLTRTDPAGWIAQSRGLSQRAPADPPDLIEVHRAEVQPGQSKRYASFGAAALSWLALPEGETASFPATVDNLVRTAQLHHAFQLVAFSDAVVSASLIAKRFASEVALGRPVLIRPANEDGESQTFDIRDFALENTTRLAVAIDRARQVTEANRRRESAADDTEGQPEAKSTAPSRVKSTGAQAPPSEGAAAPAQLPGADAPADSGAGQDAPGPDWSAVDPIGLFKRAGRMSDVMEERWSDALSEVLTDDLITGDLVQWRSLLLSEWGKVSRVDDDTRLTWPLGADAIVAMPTDHPTRAATAYLAALANLSSSLEMLAVPTNRKLVIDGDSARLHAYWSSGGFAAVSAAADMMLRTAQDIGQRHDRDAREREWLGIPQGMHAPWPEVWLGCARRALGSGLPDAALIYCLYAYDSWTDRPAKFEPGRRQEAMREFETLLPEARRMMANLAKGPESAIDLLPVALVAVSALSVALAAVELLIHEADVTSDG